MARATFFRRRPGLPRIPRISPPTSPCSECFVMIKASAKGNDLNAELHPISRRASAGFTMVELLVSIALVVVLILGINAVFKYSADAVGTGQALGDASRQNRAVQ